MTLRQLLKAIEDSARENGDLDEEVNFELMKENYDNVFFANSIIAGSTHYILADFEE